eukprot:2201757-Rhodomonas_salina.1
MRITIDFPSPTAPPAPPFSTFTPPPSQFSLSLARYAREYEAPGPGAWAAWREARSIWSRKVPSHE